MVMIKVDTGLIGRGLAVWRQALFGARQACRRRMRTGLRQALTERAHRGGKERRHE
jgi:hypothetical protein